MLMKQALHQLRITQPAPGVTFPVGPIGLELQCPEQALRQVQATCREGRGRASGASASLVTSGSTRHSWTHSP
jgi:hypothetical protein